MEQNTEATKLVCVAAAVALAGGSLFDWLTVDAGFFHIARSGIDNKGDGWATLALGLFALWAFISGATKRGAQACLVGGVVAVYDINNVQNRIADLDAPIAISAQVGNGLWICLIGAVVGTVAGFTTNKQVSAQEALSQTVMAQDPPADTADRHAKEQHDIDEAYRNLENTENPWLDPWDED